jgi:hypothetical protein
MELAFNWSTMAGVAWIHEYMVREVCYGWKVTFDNGRA